jgi:predicted PurR-regulated permease PerM
MKKTFFSQIKDKFSNIQKIKKTKRKYELEETFIPQKETKEKKYLIELSLGSIAKATVIIILLLLLFYFLYSIWDILIIFFISFLLASAFDPTVDYLQKKKIPRGIGVTIILIVILFIIGIVISNIIPIVASQIVDLATSISDFISNLNKDSFEKIPYFSKIRPYIFQFLETIDFEQVKQGLMVLADQLLSVGGNLWGALITIAGSLFNIFMVIVLTFFMSVEEKSIDNFLISLFPSRYTKYINTRISASKEKIGYWLRGQFALCVIIGILVYIGLSILGVNYAATLALIAALTELVPYLGPIIAWLITIPVAANQSPWLMLWVTILYILIQAFEENIIVPIIMEKAVGLSPIIIIFALMVGYHFVGIPGIILSIPVAATISIFIKDYTHKKK